MSFLQDSGIKFQSKIPGVGNWVPISGQTTTSSLTEKSLQAYSKSFQQATCSDSLLKSTFTIQKGVLSSLASELKRENQPVINAMAGKIQAGKLNLNPTLEKLIKAYSADMSGTSPTLELTPYESRLFEGLLPHSATVAIGTSQVAFQDDLSGSLVKGRDFDTFSMGQVHFVKPSVELQGADLTRLEARGLKIFDNVTQALSSQESATLPFVLFKADESIPGFVQNSQDQTSQLAVNYNGETFMLVKMGTEFGIMIPNKLDDSKPDKFVRLENLVTQRLGTDHVEESVADHIGRGPLPSLPYEDVSGYRPLGIVTGPSYEYGNVEPLNSNTTDF